MLLAVVDFPTKLKVDYLGFEQYEMMPGLEFAHFVSCRLGWLHEPEVLSNPFC